MTKREVRVTIAEGLPFLGQDGTVEDPSARCGTEPREAEMTAAVIGRWEVRIGDRPVFGADADPPRQISHSQPPKDVPRLQ